MKEKKIYKIVFEPVLASLLADRRLALLVFGIGAIQALLTSLGCWSWPCPMHAIIGLPCPGCGLSRGLVSLLAGQWQTALQHHLFSPLLLIVLTLLGISSLLPTAAHSKFVCLVKAAEKRTGISFFVISGMFVVWVLRSVAG